MSDLSSACAHLVKLHSCTGVARENGDICEDKFKFVFRVTSQRLNTKHCARPDYARASLYRPISFRIVVCCRTFRMVSVLVLTENE